MQALVLYGKEKLALEQVPDPEIEQDDELIVRILNAGICGSDKHYFKLGANGTFRVREPFIPGHEGCGIVVEKGRAVKNFSEGELLVFRPPLECGKCRFCQRGWFRFCEDVKHLGSAARLPHTPGLFAEYAKVNMRQCLAIKNTSPGRAAIAEPLSVAYAALNALGNVLGLDIAVMGDGPIGLLCAAAAKTLGASSVTLIGLKDHALKAALQLGADRVINSAVDPDAITACCEHKGSFDAGIEASGSAEGCTQLMRLVRPQGQIAQVGVFAENAPLPDLGPFAVKGLRWQAVFRFYEEFNAAVSALERGLINPDPIISGVFEPARYREAFDFALSPESIKVEFCFAKA